MDKEYYEQKYKECLSTLMKIGGLAFFSLENDVEDPNYYVYVLGQIKDMVKDIIHV